MIRMDEPAIALQRPRLFEAAEQFDRGAHHASGHSFNTHTRYRVVIGGRVYPLPVIWFLATGDMDGRGRAKARENMVGLGFEVP